MRGSNSHRHRSRRGTHSCPSRSSPERTHRRCALSDRPTHLLADEDGSLRARHGARRPREIPAETNVERLLDVARYDAARNEAQIARAEEDAARSTDVRSGKRARIVFEENVAPPKDRYAAREEPGLITRESVIAVPKDPRRDVLRDAHRGEHARRLTDRPFDGMHAIGTRGQVRRSDILARRDEVIEFFGKQCSERNLETQRLETEPWRARALRRMNVDTVPADAARICEARAAGASGRERTFIGRR